MDPSLGGILVDEQGDAEGGDDRGHRAEHEDEADAPDDGRAEGADRRADEQAAHLRCAIQPECFALTLRRGRVRQVAARGRVVDRRAKAGQSAQDDERERADEDQREGPEDAAGDQAHDHQGYPGRSVGDPAEERFGQQTGCRPRGDDHAHRREVHAVLAEVDGQDREQTTKSQPDHELRDQERQDRPPAIEPGGGAHAGARDGRAG